MHDAGAAVLIGLVTVLAGCQATREAAVGGVLSVIQQKALERATHEAIAQAGMSGERVARDGMCVRLADVDEEDAGKRYVAQVIRDHYREINGGGARTGGREIACQIPLAGVDIVDSGFLFIRSVATDAEVQLRFRDPGTDSIVTAGTGRSTHKQTWLFGLGPSVKWE